MGFDPTPVPLVVLSKLADGRGARQVANAHDHTRDLLSAKDVHERRERTEDRHAFDALPPLEGIVVDKPYGPEIELGILQQFVQGEHAASTGANDQGRAAAAT